MTGHWNGIFECEAVKSTSSSCGVFHSRYRIMFRESEVSEILDDADKARFPNRCTLVMKNGSRHHITEKFETAVKMVFGLDMTMVENKK